MSKTLLILVLCGVFLSGSVAYADSFNMCNLNSETWTCELYIHPTESGTSLLLPFWITPGYVVFMDSGDPGPGYADPVSYPDQANQSLWSEVLYFPENPNPDLPEHQGLSNSVIVISAAAGELLPRINLVFAEGASVWFQRQSDSDSDPTIYVADSYDPETGTFGHVYELFQAPEPVSAGTLALGLAALGVLGRRRSLRRPGPSS